VTAAGPRRGPALLAIAALLVGATVADLAGRSGASTHAAAQPVMPTAAPADALSSSWYCPLATASAEGQASGTIVVANPTRHRIGGRVTLFAVGGRTVEVPISVAALSRQTMREADHLQAPYVAAEVDLDGGRVVVEQVVSGSLGDSISACASMASPHWYFAEGNTSKDAVYLLSLFNPFPEDAITDLSFTTDQGRAVPDAFQGLVVPAHGLTVVNVGDHVRRRDAVSTTVSVRSGQVVASKLQTYTGGGHKGIALVLGAPQLGTSWSFPDGFFSDGVAERFHVYNPGSNEASVQLSVALEQGAAEPFDITVPSQGRFTLTISGESRVPKGDGHAVIAQSANGVPVVVERTIDSAAPAPRLGYTDVVGARSTATSWVLAAGGTTDAFDEWVVVFNAGRRAAHVSVTGLAAGQALAIDGLQDVAVPAGQRRALRIGDHVKRPDLPMLVESDIPVVVERGMFRAGAIGMASTVGIPLR
jgi:hypothetical protein